MNLVDKQAALEHRLRDLGSVIVAYSGGVDSAYLAWVAHRVLDAGMLAALADSASLARSHYRDAVEFADETGHSAAGAGDEGIGARSLRRE